MAKILNINTALETASVTIGINGIPGEITTNESPRDHASWLHPAIEKLFISSSTGISGLDAVAISNGPGSYTGLRIGLAAAKGICFSLKIPLITIPTVEVMAFSVKDEPGDLIIPLIDARRNEVFTAVYDRLIRVKNSTYALIIHPGSFDDLLGKNKIIFCGNAIKKASEIIRHPNALFSVKRADAGHLSALAEQRYVQKSFADLAYSEPFYIKDFHSPGH